MTISDLLFELATGLILVFGLILFYQKLGNSVILAALPMALLHFTHASLLPFISKLIFKVGIKKSLIIGVFFYLVASLTLFLSSELSWQILVLWAILQAFGNAFHYIPVIYSLGHNTTDSNRGRLFGLRKIAFIVLGVASPLLGGFTAQNFNLFGIIALAMGVYITSLIPISLMDDFSTRKLLSIRKVFKEYTSRKIIAFRTVQVVNHQLNSFWPLFIFLLLGDSFIQLGILFAVVNLLSIVIAYIVGNNINHNNELKLYADIKWSSTFVWFIRTFSFNYWTAILTDTIYKLNETFKSSVQDVIDYEMLNNSKHSDIKIEFIVIREITSNYATAITYLLFPIIITFFGFHNSFIIIGVVSFIGMSIVQKILHRDLIR